MKEVSTYSERLYLLQNGLDGVSSIVNPAHLQEMCVSVELKLENDVLHATLKDNGIPFNPLIPRDSHLDADVDERPIGGLGIFLTHTFMDHIAYERQENTNVLKLESHMKRKAE